MNMEMGPWSQLLPGLCIGSASQNLYVRRSDPATTADNLNAGGNPLPRHMFEFLDTANAVKLHV